MKYTESQSLNNIIAKRLNNEVRMWIRLSTDEKWSKQLSLKCGVEPRFLQLALEELKESCGADSRTSKEIIEELTTTCRFSEKDLREFVKDVAKNCPLDIKELHKEIINADGQKEKAFQAVQNVVGDTDLRKRSSRMV
jgi:hypothetical protein